MLNAFKIKLHRLTMSRKKPDPNVFVNPYASKLPGEDSKINPYVTSYGTKKTKSFQEMLLDKIRGEKEESFLSRSLPHPALHVDDREIAPATPMPPSFIHDMKEMVVGDLFAVASKFPKYQKKERSMSADEIRQACESIKWQ